MLLLAAANKSVRQKRVIQTTPMCGIIRPGLDWLARPGREIALNVAIFLNSQQKRITTTSSSQVPSYQNKAWQLQALSIQKRRACW